MKNELLGLLQYNGEKKIIVADQNVEDIMREMIKTHELHKNDYNKIYHFFIRSTPEKTCKAIFDFLKKNVKYVIESSKNQKLKSPGGIVYTGNTTGSDCKNYSLFTNGIIDAINRSGKMKIPFCYRFASYKIYEKNPQHVFSVAYPGTKKEIWIDPVLPGFDQRKMYEYKIDKKPMALYQVSGIDDAIGRRSRSERRARRKERKATRKAKRKERRAAGCKGIKGRIKRTAGAPTRAAFLALVSINAFGLANKLKIAQEADQTALRNFWLKECGDYVVLERAIRKGSKKRRLLGVTDPDEMGFKLLSSEIDAAFVGCPSGVTVGAAPAALAAKAARILAKFKKFFKSLKAVKKLQKLKKLKLVSKLQKLKQGRAFKTAQKIRDVAERGRGFVERIREMEQGATEAGEAPEFENEQDQQDSGDE